MKRNIPFSLLTLLFILWGFSAHAQLLNENFNFTGNLTNNAWTVIATGGINPITASNATGLSYSGFANSNNGNAATLASSGEDLRKNVSTPWDSTVSTALYATFMLKITNFPSAAGDYICGFTSEPLGNNYDLRFFVSPNGSYIDFGIGRRGGTPVFSGNYYALNQTYLVTLKYTFVGGASNANDICSFYVHPVGTITATEPATLTATYNTTGAADGIDASQITSFFLRQGTATNNVSAVVDGILVTKDWASSVASLVGTCRYSDSLALVDLYNATAGASWTNRTNWLTSYPIDTWYGVVMNAQGCVDKIALSSNNLTGTIPTSIGNITTLTELSMSSNKLTGTIPTEIGNLVALQYLNLLINKLSGTIPPTIVNLTQLLSLRLEVNQLTGSIPTNIGNLTKLQDFRLTQNQLSGTIPLSILSLTNLQTLDLGYNSLTGTIPTNIGNLNKLTTLYLYSNQLTGTIPTSIGSLTALQYLSLDRNQLTGTIPTVIGSLTNLVSLYLYSNLLDGSIPTNISNLTKLNRIFLHDNRLTGTVPALAPAVQSTLTTGNLDIKSNRFTFSDILPNFLAIETYAPQDSVFTETTYTGTVGGPLSINLGFDAATTTNVYKWYKNGTLYQTITGNNTLTFSSLLATDAGVYTCQITNPTAPLLTLNSRKATVVVNPNLSCRYQDSLELVALYNATDGVNWTNKTNWLTANPIDTWFGITVNAQGCVSHIVLNTNNLIGTIPTSIGNLAALHTLYLYENRLNGPLPNTLLNLSLLAELNLGDNLLTGTIPNFNLPNLVEFKLNINQLTGAIPNFILPKLAYIALDNNQLTGSIPNFNFPLLEYFFLYQNKLSGAMPNFNYPNLLQLDVHFNQLTGTIPNFNLPKIEELCLSNNQFSGSVPNFSYPNLKKLCLNDNQLSGAIPVIQTTVSFGCQNNKYTFNGILPNVPPISNKIYAPQDSVFTETTYTGTVGGPLSINLGFDASVTTNVYKWYKNGTLHQTITGNNTLTFSSLLATDAGVYTCQITNPNASLLTLYSRKATVAVTPNLSCRYQDSLELVSLYNATAGANWTNKWNLAQPMTTWYGVTLNATGCVKCLDLDGQLDCIDNFTTGAGNNLVGTIPNLNLPNLTALSLSYNKLTGAIPNFNLPNLQYLELAYNQLSGAIPNFNLPNLITIYFTSNQLSGAIPDFNLPNLTKLYLYNNKLTSTIPNFNNLPKLFHLYLNQNLLSGTIPNFNLPKLSTLYLYTNQLTGAIPNLSLAALQYLNISNNQLSGCIPQGIKTNCPLIGASNGYISGNTSLATQSWANYWNNGEGACLPCASVTASISGTTTICGTNSTTLTATTNAVAPTYAWSTAATTANINTSSTGSYTVTVSQSDGCTKTANVTVTNTVIATPSVSTITQPTCSIATGSVVLNGLPATGTWTINPGAITGTGTSTTISSLSVGTYNFTVTNAAGCTSSASTNVVINPQPATPTVTLIPIQPVCNQNNGSITANVTGGQTPYTYQWSNTATTATISNLSANTPTNFSVTITDLNNCSATKSVSLTCVPATCSNVTLRNAATFCEGKTFTLPKGSVVNIAGIYRDTFKVSTCDSIIETTLTMNVAAKQTLTPSVCGTSYTLPSRRIVTNSGIYADTVRNVAANGCDSIYTIRLTLTDSIVQNVTASINQGQTYTLPSGSVVSAAGRYRSVLQQRITSCDSIIYTNLTVVPIGVDTTTCRYKDSLQLVILYNATGGANWTNKWNLAQPITTWYGVTLNATGCVTCIDLDGNLDCAKQYSNGNNLIGTIPNLNLPNLQSLSLSHNQLSGTIPNFVLPNLQYLILSNNRLNSLVPNFNLPNLQYLQLESNALSGTLPNFNLPNLQFLSCVANRLTGNIPNLVLPKLQVLALELNQLTGSIPNFVLPDLKELYLDKNQLTGTIPSLNLPKLTNLALNDNQLSGCIPLSIKTNCPFIGPNGGSVSNNIGLNTQIWANYWNNNEGACIVTPTCRTNDSLELVALYNATNGANWTNKWNLTQPITTWYAVSLNATGCVQELNLFANNLTSAAGIPNLNLSELKILRLQGNKIAGTIPSLTGLPLLDTLDLGGNSITGFSSQTALPNLTYLNLNTNKIAGALPNLSLPKLKELFLGINQFSGTLTHYPNLPNLVKYHVQANNLTGIVPLLTAMPKLTELQIEDNDFDSLPRQSGMMQPINHFWMKGNRLTFDDILPNSTLPFTQTAAFAYTPQDSVFVETTYTKATGDPLSINLGFDAAITNNVYKWFKNGMPFQTITGNNTLIFSSLLTTDAGVYTCEITNPNAPLLTLYSRKATVVVVPSCPVATTTSQTPVLCGSQTYTLPNGQIVNTATNYRDTLRNRNGCDSLIRIVNVTKGGNPTTTTSNPTICPGQSYTLLNGQIVTPSVTTTYRDTVRTPVGCDSLIRITNLMVRVLPSLTNNITVSDVVCNGQSNGSVTINLVGGAANLVFNWAGPNGFSSNSQNISNLKQGDYRITISDNLGCNAISNTVIVKEPTLISIGTATIGSDSCQRAKGNITINSITGGNSGYSFLWNNGATSQNLRNIAASNYTLTVTDSKGCKTSNSFVVQNNGETTAPIRTVILCTKDSFQMPISQKWVKKAGIYNDTSVNSFGCGHIMPIQIVAIPKINAVDDAVEMLGNANELDIPFLANDNIAAHQVNISIKRQPNIGSVAKKGDDMFHATMPRTGNGIATFSYQICHKTCPTECDTATVQITIKGRNPYEKIETAISPNGDGKNDVLDLPEIDWAKYPNNKMELFNRWGQRVFFAEPYKRDWRGQNTEGVDLSAGDYFMILSLSIGDGKVVIGSVYLTR